MCAHSTIVSSPRVSPPTLDPVVSSPSLACRLGCAVVGLRRSSSMAREASSRLSRHPPSYPVHACGAWRGATVCVARQVCLASRTPGRPRSSSSSAVVDPISRLAGLLCTDSAILLSTCRPRLPTLVLRFVARPRCCHLGRRHPRRVVSVACLWAAACTPTFALALRGLSAGRQ